MVAASPCVRIGPSLPTCQTQKSAGHPWLSSDATGGHRASLVRWSVTCFATNDAPLSISRLPFPSDGYAVAGEGGRRDGKRPCSNDRKHPPGKPVAFIGLLQTVSRTYNRTPRPTVVVSLPLPFPARSWNNSGSRSDAPHSRLKDRAMREPPPAQLTALLKQLGLATDRDFEGVEANVHRMAGNLPRFESVWIDALRQARVLTQFQAAEFHAGRGEALKVRAARSVPKCPGMWLRGCLPRGRPANPRNRPLGRLLLDGKPSSPRPRPWVHGARHGARPLPSCGVWQAGEGRRLRHNLKNWLLLEEPCPAYPG